MAILDCIQDNRVCVTGGIYFNGKVGDGVFVQICCQMLCQGKRRIVYGSVHVCMFVFACVRACVSMNVDVHM